MSLQMNVPLSSVTLLILLMMVRLTDSATCSPDATVCHFKLFIEPRLTMMNGKMRVRPCNGRLCNYNESDPLDPSVEDTIITADGVYARLVISVNNSVPGPELIVYEDQMVEVLVTNNLHTDSVTLHFHGAHQKGTPYMDGVAYITQCPIHPGHTFNYTFKATPHGTHWYHAHIGDQRSMGLYGPYIVKRRNEPNDYVDEHIITLQDWNHDMDPETAYQKMLNGIFNCNIEGTVCDEYKPTGSVDGGKFSAFQFHSGLINGKGRYYINSKKATHNNAPLTTYTVEPNKLYRFRVISASTLYPFRLYVAGHKITVIASDGRELRPIEVESFVINTGERMDFIVNTSRSDGKFMIVAETLEVLASGLYHAAEAIMEYKNATSTPVDTPVPCSDFEDGFCPVFNCPFLHFRQEDLRKCITFHDASATPEEVPPDHESIISGTADQTFFLNFAFPGRLGNTPGSVNGRQFVSPTVSAYSQPNELGPVLCEGKGCGKESICECMYTINIEKDQIIDIVLLNMGVGRGWSHPVHIHGHSFYIVAMDFPEYNIQTGEKIKQNPDINCKETSFCNNVTWTGRSGRKKRDVDEERIPPLKDTIIVPTDGYVITRFKADNPGVWFIHCHIDLHNTNGMAMVMNESFTSQPSAPGSMPRCRDYLDPEDYRQRESSYICSANDFKSSMFFTILVMISTMLYLDLL